MFEHSMLNKNVNRNELNNEESETEAKVKLIGRTE
jgi:hypothetical protein